MRGAGSGERRWCLSLPCEGDVKHYDTALRSRKTTARLQQVVPQWLQSIKLPSSNCILRCLYPCSQHHFTPLTHSPNQPLQPEANFTKAANFIASAADQGAQLAVLPEYHLTSWVPDDPQFIPLCAQWETYLNKYKELAKKLEICIVPGTIVQTYKHRELEEDQLHNVAYFIDNKGEVLGRYQKKNLWYSYRRFRSYPCLFFL